MDQIVDQLEELVVTIVEEIRQRPGVAVAIVAAVAGAVVGTLFAAGVGRPRASPAAEATRRVRGAARVTSRARGASQALDLAGLGVKLFQNPLVRGYVLSMIESQIKKRFSR